MKRLPLTLLLSLCLLAALSMMPADQPSFVPGTNSVHAGDGVMIPGIQPTPTPTSAVDPVSDPCPEPAGQSEPGPVTLWFIYALELIGQMT